jgi:hypothetical protein
MAQSPCKATKSERVNDVQWNRPPGPKTLTGQRKEDAWPNNNPKEPPEVQTLHKRTKTQEEAWHPATPDPAHPSGTGQRTQTTQPHQRQGQPLRLQQLLMPQQQQRQRQPPRHTSPLSLT